MLLEEQEQGNGALPFCSKKIVVFRGGGSQWTDLGWKPTKMFKPNEAMLVPSDDVGFLAILGEFWSWGHPQPTSKGRNLSEAKDMASQMITKSLPK